MAYSICITFTLLNQTVNILLFFDLQKNGAESLLESQMNTKYDFFKNFKPTFQALKWDFVIPKGQESVLNRV
jgi:hypothetical protein